MQAGTTPRARAPGLAGAAEAVGAAARAAERRPTPRIATSTLAGMTRTPAAAPARRGAVRRRTKAMRASRKVQPPRMLVPAPTARRAPKAKLAARQAGAAAGAGSVMTR